jgi:hypothetical protein
MKSLDHWPDMGSDLDVFTTGNAKEICSFMKREFAAERNPQGWSEKLACKFNFRIPGLKRFVEIHVGRLGQTGQQTRLGRTLLQRRTNKPFGAFEFMVPSPQDQLLLGVLDRLYRHHFLRICDVVNTADLIKNNQIDFEQLKQESKQAGIRRGLASYLSVIDEYYVHYQGSRLPIPANIKKGASFGADKVYAHAGFLRVPLFPQSAGLFTRELAKAVKRKDICKSLRISLLPPLAVAAGVRFRITGRTKGIW